MKKQWISVLAMLALVMALSVSAMAQAGTTKVSGTVKDEAGQPIAGANVELLHKNTGRKYNIKTDKKGFYIQLGVQSGPYKVTLTKDGKVLWTLENFQVALTPEDMVKIDLDLAHEKKAAVTEGAKTMTEAQKKELERVNTENAKIGNLNKMLSEGAAALDAENYDLAIATFKKTTEADPTRDLLWARLGDAYIAAAKKETDSAARKEKYTEGAAAYKKALDLATAPVAERVSSVSIKTPGAVGAYFNNMAEALGKSGDVNAAVEAYDKAAEADPANAAMFYFNKGATLTNAGKTDDALAAFNKAIESDPNRADAYYYRGIALLSKATMKGNEMVPAPGTAEAFNKYLELEPDGKLAQQAKDMLAAIGAKVETTYRSGKKGTKK